MSKVNDRSKQRAKDQRKLKYYNDENPFLELNMLPSQARKRQHSVRSKVQKTKENSDYFNSNLDKSATKSSSVSLRSIFSNFATEHRGWFVLFFVLPFSLMFDVYFALRAFLIMKFYSAPHLHAQKVSKIQKQVKAWYDSGEKTKLCTARGGWQSISPQMRKYKNKSTRININLYDILDLDEKKMTVKVEPGVNMGQISHYLISKGFTLPVLPEMDDLTVGGMIMGVGIETSSHKYGLFNDRVNLLEMEIILSNGDLVVCSENENRDFMMPSHGVTELLASWQAQL